MIYRKLGATNLQVSAMGLGLAALGRPGYINFGHAQDLEKDYSPITMENRAHAVLDAAHAAGVRYFDAARSYGRAEAFLESWLRKRDLSPDEVVTGSKWGYTYTADWRVEAEVHEVKDHSVATLRRQWQETQSHLSARLGLYQIHSATLESGVLENTAVLTELSRIKQESAIAIGLSVSGPQQSKVIELALRVKVDGERLFDTVQATWNLLEQSAGPVLKDAAAAGLGVIIKEGLANGRLTARNAEESDFRKLENLRQQANLLNTSVDALALAAVLAQPWVSVVLSGAATSEHLASNLQALAINWNAELETQLLPLMESPVEYWQKRSNLKWN